jgi:hypothetical protein
MKFGGYEDQIRELGKLLDEWRVRSSLLSRLVKDELLEATARVEETFKRQDLYDTFKEIEQLGIALEKTYTHMQDLGQVFNRMWDLVKDKIK